MTAIIVENVLSIRVHNQGEYGTFHLWSGPRDKEGTYWCELSIYSAFGCVGHHWSHIGGFRPHEFLAGVDCDYLMGKLFGANHRVFDYQTTINEIKRVLFRQMRSGDFDYNQYRPRELYEQICDIPHCIDEAEFYREYQEAFNTRIDEHELSDWLQPGDVPVMRKINPQAQGLWEKLWPEYITALKKDWNDRHPICEECKAPMPTQIGGLQTHNAGCTRIPF